MERATQNKNKNLHNFFFKYVHLKQYIKRATAMLHQTFFWNTSHVMNFLATFCNKSNKT